MDHGFQWTAMRAIVPLLLALIAFPSPSHADVYKSSVVGTDFDFIHESDPSAFLCLEFKGRGIREMPDKSGPTQLHQEAFIFVAYFSDGTSTDIAIDIDFETEATARTEALRYTPRLGKLPTSLRRGVRRLVIHKGNPDTTAFSDRGLIVLYSANATKRISTHDLEETVFHESVHASWDKEHAQSQEWLDAQSTDGAFITRYAKKNPVGEDLAESALFAYTLIHHPERIPKKDAAKIKSTIPARIAFVQKLLPPDEPILYQVRPRYACDGTGITFQSFPPGYPGCRVDLTKVGTLSDIVSNALNRGLDRQELDVRRFLKNAHQRFETADDLLRATSEEFDVDRKTLDAQVQAFYHCNCSHSAESEIDPEPEAEADAEDAGGNSPESLTATREPSPTIVTEAGRPRVVSNNDQLIYYVIAGLLLALLVVSLLTLLELRKRR